MATTSGHKGGDLTSLIPTKLGNFKSHRQVVRFRPWELKALLDFHKKVNSSRKADGLKGISLSRLIRVIVIKFIADYTDPFFFMKIPPTMED